MTLEILTSDVLFPVRHGFFSRRGGLSSGIFSDLNCGNRSSDLAEVVALNRKRVAAAMDISIEDLIGMHQVHSPTVITVDGPHTGDKPTADAVVTATPGLALTILTADCQPVLFADSDANVIGAAHAGWRGALDGILEATLDAMEALGARRDNTIAVIGPTISQHAYEVGPEFLDNFIADSSNNTRFFVNGQDDRMHFDLPAFGLHRLRQAGIGKAEWTHHCTYSDPDRFFSYRRSTHANEPDYGRLISAIRL